MAITSLSAKMVPFFLPSEGLVLMMEEGLRGPHVEKPHVSVLLIMLLHLLLLLLMPQLQLQPPFWKPCLPGRCRDLARCQRRCSLPHSALLCIAAWGGALAIDIQIPC